MGFVGRTISLRSLVEGLAREVLVGGAARCHQSLDDRLGAPLVERGRHRVVKNVGILIGEAGEDPFRNPTMPDRVGAHLGAEPLDDAPIADELGEAPPHLGGLAVLVGEDAVEIAEELHRLPIIRCIAYQSSVVGAAVGLGPEPCAGIASAAVGLGPEPCAGIASAAAARHRVPDPEQSHESEDRRTGGGPAATNPNHVVR